MSDDTTQTPETGNENDSGSGNASGDGSGSTPNGGGSRPSIDSFPEDAQDYIRRLRQEAAGHRREVKEERERRESLETDGKQQLTAAESRAQELEGRLLRFEVAAEKGLPMNLAGRLQGGDKKALEEDADALKKEFGLDDSGGNAGAGGFDGGPRRSTSKQPQDMNGLIRQLAGRR